MRRWARLVQDDFLCQVCGAEASDVHHLTYARIYQELPEDLISLCRRCHQAVTELAHTYGHERGRAEWIRLRAEVEAQSAPVRPAAEMKPRPVQRAKETGGGLVLRIRA